MLGKKTSSEFAQYRSGWAASNGTQQTPTPMPVQLARCGCHQKFRKGIRHKQCPIILTLKAFNRPGRVIFNVPTLVWYKSAWMPIIAIVCSCVEVLFAQKSSDTKLRRIKTPSIIWVNKTFAQNRTLLGIGNPN